MCVFYIIYDRLLNSNINREHRGKYDWRYEGPFLDRDIFFWMTHLRRRKELLEVFFIIKFDFMLKPFEALISRIPYYPTNTNIVSATAFFD